MPTIKVPDSIYKRLVKYAGKLQDEYGRMVTVGEALELIFKKLDEMDLSKLEIPPRLERMLDKLDAKATECKE
jgi:hypothetical protein